MRDSIHNYSFYKSERFYANTPPGSGGGGGPTPIYQPLVIYLPSSDGNNVTVSQPLSLDDYWYVQFTSMIGDGNPPTSSASGYYDVFKFPQYERILIWEVPTNITTYDLANAKIITGFDDENGTTTNNSNLFAIIKKDYPTKGVNNTHKVEKYLGVYPTGKKVVDLYASYADPLDWPNNPKQSIKNDPNYYTSTTPKPADVSFTVDGLYVEETYQVTKSNSDFYKVINEDYFDSNARSITDTFLKGYTFQINRNYLITTETYADNSNDLSAQLLNGTFRTSTAPISLQSGTYQYFKTPPSEIGSINPTVYNTGFTNVNNGTSQNQCSLTLNGKFSFNFSNPPYSIPDGYQAVEWGFEFDNTPTIKFYVNSTDGNFNDQLYDTQKIYRQLSFSTTLTGLVNNTLYSYYVYVIDKSGRTFKSNSLSVKTPPAGIFGYTHPQTPTKWYQLYKNWELVENGNSGLSYPGIYPFFRIVRSGTTANRIYPLFNYIENTTFYSNKNYKFRIITENFEGGCSFSITTPWGESFEFENIQNSSSNKKINLFLYTNLNSTQDTISLNKLVSSQNPSQNPLTIKANDNFGKQDQRFIDINISEYTWIIQGFGLFNFFNIKKLDLNSPDNSIKPVPSNTNLVFDGSDEIVDKDSGRGWHFIDKKSEYIWINKYYPNNNVNLPIGGDVTKNFSNKTQDVKWLKNNFIAKKINNQSFNIKFKYQIDTNNPDLGFKIYLSGTLPTLDNNNEIYSIDLVLLKTLKGSNSTKDYEFVGIQGNQYIIFVGDTITKPGDYLVCKISDLKTAGGYNEKNNDIFNTVDSKYTINSLTGVSYQTSIGEGNTEDSSGIITTKSKAGNGKFLNGIWENGVWNSGRREDTSMKELYKIEKFSSSGLNKVWNIEISGTKTSVSSFNIGDKVAISNIVAIDINEDRKLLTKYYTVLSKTEKSITVKIENDFPLRRIEKDSPNHRIMITKNIWLSGVFLNGYFKGIWNNGLFSGYPLITKMDQSHWIEGIYNGGHFTSRKYSLNFTELSMITYDNSKRVKVKFQIEHRLTEGDIISIISTNMSTMTTLVVSVLNDTELITGLAWKSTYTNISGTIKTTIATGLIQNFDFYSNNVSTVTSLISLDTKRVFSYNSWIDVNYSTQSAVNIGKPQSFTDEISGVKYSENNLYGYPTIDILSSNSSFRDSFSTNFRKYKLGTKYKIFEDYVGDSSKFEDAFDTTDSQTGLDSFKKLGWSISKSTENGASLTFSRTPEPLDETSITKGNELMVYTKGKGGNLNLTPTYDILNRSNSEIEKLRYSLVEFDLKFENKPNLSYTDSLLGEQPPIHFSNLNYVNRNIVLNGVTISNTVIANYLPVYKNINHLTTSEERKQEFFFNRRNLLMNFRGLGNLGQDEMTYYLDNIKLYQIDMIPFFQYFTSDNINRSVQIPNQRLSPTIDWIDEDQETNILSNFVDDLIIENIEVTKDINWKSDFFE